MESKKSFPLRVDREIYEALEKWAADEFRSVNSHLEFLLRDALKRSGRLKKLNKKNQIKDEFDQ